MIKINCEQRSECWFQVRAGRVTGTRFIELMAGEKTAAFQRLINNLVVEIITGKIEEGYCSPIMENGIRQEPFAREEYSQIMGIEVEQTGFIIPDEENPFHEWIGISPDGLLPDRGLLEIKCPLRRTHLEYIFANKLPAEYRYQVQGQLFVTSSDYVDFMSYVEDMKPFIIRVYPDRELFDEFEKRLNLLIPEVKRKLEIYNNYDYLS